MTIFVTEPGVVDITVPDTIPTDGIRIDSFSYDFNNPQITFYVYFGVANPPPFVPLQAQTWLVQGVRLQAILDEAPIGATWQETQENIAKDIVGRIQADPVLKQNLLDTGELNIR